MNKKNKRRIAYIVIFIISVLLWILSILFQYIIPTLEIYSPDTIVILLAFIAVIIVNRKWSEKPDNGL